MWKIKERKELERAVFVRLQCLQLCCWIVCMKIDDDSTGYHYLHIYLMMYRDLILVDCGELKPEHIYQRSENNVKCVE